jgi:hypothetical protein
MRKRVPLRRRTRKEKSVVQKYFEHALRADVECGLLKPEKKLVEYRKEYGKILIKENDVADVKKHLTPEFFNSKIEIKNFISYELRESH